MTTWKLAILANGAVQSLTTAAHEGDPYDSDVRPPREPTPIGKAVIGVIPPILGIHPGQSRIPDDLHLDTTRMGVKERFRDRC